MSKETWVGLLKHIRSIQLDTGANGTFMYSDIEPYLKDAQDSSAVIKTANKWCMYGRKSGRLVAQVLNIAGYESVQATTELDIKATSVEGLSKELLSADDYFRYGKFNVHVLLQQPDFEDGVQELWLSRLKLELFEAKTCCVFFG